MKIRLLESVGPRAVAALAATLLGCGSGSGDKVIAPDADAYFDDIATWRLERVERLKGRDGFLNLVGLFWVRRDISTFGSSPESDFVLPPGAPSTVGIFRRENGRLIMAVHDDVEVFRDEMPIKEIIMEDDRSERPVVLTHDSLAWTVIRRDDRLAVRVRDYDSPAIAAFKPIEYFSVDMSYRLPALLKRFHEPRQLRVDTVITGLDWKPESPGMLIFEIGGTTFELEAYDSGDELFIVFGDRTSGRETYPAGRFLYAAMPGESGMTVLDFNKAYNPPCAFNEFATCPVASPQNRLNTRILAGERFDASMHLPSSGH